jgi:hypothetical protein
MIFFYASNAVLFKCPELTPTLATPLPLGTAGEPDDDDEATDDDDDDDDDGNDNDDTAALCAPAALAAVAVWLGPSLSRRRWALVWDLARGGDVDGPSLVWHAAARGDLARALAAEVGALDRAQAAAAAVAWNFSEFQVAYPSLSAERSVAGLWLRPLSQLPTTRALRAAMRVAAATAAAAPPASAVATANVAAEVPPGGGGGGGGGERVGLFVRQFAGDALRVALLDRRPETQRLVLAALEKVVRAFGPAASNAPPSAAENGGTGCRCMG